MAGPLAAQSTRVDWLVRGGSVYDGSGAAPVRADLGIRGDRIVFVGDAAARGVTGERTIDASGLVVTPGFIDAHTHAGEDLSRAATAGVPHILLQGVTTVVLGNDGGGGRRGRAGLAARGSASTSPSWSASGRFVRPCSGCRVASPPAPSWTGCARWPDRG
ncbi:MAG: amidohydrolase family protein [Gemmatimonadales bacterium]